MLRSAGTGYPRLCPRALRWVICFHSPTSSLSGFSSHFPKLSPLGLGHTSTRSAGLTKGTWSVQGEVQVQSCLTLDHVRGIYLPQETLDFWHGGSPAERCAPTVGLSFPIWPLTREHLESVMEVG